MRNKGFTLVELLAVIVILAIIMLIAIPAVLNTMQSANKSTFETYARRIANETQKKFTEDSLNNSNTQAKIYNITKDLGIDNTGDFKGYSIVSQKTNTVYLTLYNKEYAYVAVNMSNADLKKELKIISSVDPDYLTPEYLCSVVEEYTSCSYSVIDEDGNETNNSISPINHAFDALLITGEEFKNKMSTLISLNSITEIKYGETIPEENKIDVSSTDSKYPVYIWNEGNIIYYGSTANRIFLNSECRRMFKDLISLETIDISKLRFDDVEWAYEMFSGDTNLKNIDTSLITFKNIKYTQYMFRNCTSLSGTIDLSNSSFNNLENMTHMFNNCENIEYVKLPNTKNRVTSIAGLFSNCLKLKRIYNIENFDASHLLTMNQAFKLCHELEEVDMSKWNVPFIEEMEYAFEQAYQIKTLDFSGFDFSNLIKINSMAINATNLEHVIFKKKNFINLTSFFWVFTSTSLTEIDLSNAEFPKLVTISNSFSNCKHLKKADLSNINAPLLTNIRTLFSSCLELEDLNMSNFVAPKIDDMTMLFSNCKKLKSIDLSSLNASEVRIMNQAFYNNESLEVLDLSGIKSTIVEEMSNTFNGSINLRTIYISRGWSNNNVINKNSTFYNCSSLKGSITYDKNKTSADYARVEDGYFTLKG